MSKITLAQLAALDADPAKGAEFDRRWVDDPAKTVGERFEAMALLADEIVGRRQ